MTDLVDRLAKLQHENICCEHSDDVDTWERGEVRWWLKAIADVLDEEFPLDDYTNNRWSWDIDDLIQWLRAQAQEGDDESG